MRKMIQSWLLFRVLTLATSAAVLLALPFADFHSVSGPLFMIRHSVRCALPCFFLAFTASSLVTLWPNKSTRWLLSNRRYFGLTFAVGMAWQLVFIGWLAVAYFARFAQEIGGFALIPRGIPYLFLLAMTLTSFRFFARHLSVTNWRRVHKTGMYLLWLTITPTYMIPDPNRPDSLRYIVLGLFLSAWVLRIAAWTGKRALRRARSGQALTTNGESPKPRIAAPTA